MTTREKIIVGLMCLAIIYGAWELIGNRKPAPPVATGDENPVEQARAFISDLSKKMIAEKIPDGYSHIINQAGEGWPRDPFLMHSEPIKAQPETPAKPSEPEKIAEQRPNFVYSGFLQVGDTRLAIVNGLEYGVGDSLNIDGYYVKSISPLIVVLSRINGSETVQLPMQESFPE